MKLQHNEIDENVPKSFTTEDAIRGYFQQITKELIAFECYNKVEHQIDFLKLRRFLVTTYNNLQDLDLEINTSEITQLYKNLQALNTLYDNFKQRALHIKKAFDELFLSQNDEFVKVQKQFEENKGLIQYHERLIQITDREIKKLETLIKTVPESSEYYLPHIEKIKSAKAKSVDNVHYKRSLEEENYQLAQYIYMVINENEETFKVKFSLQASIFNQRIIILLNKIAYAFDVSLWKEAKHSKVITKYFEKLQIKGTISSLTYLKYYLQSLSLEKLTDEKRALFQLLPYLESLEQRSILYLSDDIDQSIRIRKILASITMKIDVTVVSDTKMAYKKLQEQTPDYIVVDFSSNFKQLITLLRKLGIENECIVILLINQTDDVLDDRYKQIFIDYIIGTRVSSKELLHKLSEIIE